MFWIEVFVSEYNSRKALKDSAHQGMQELDNELIAVWTEA